jgi:tetratricopeptide (TPR) repeat protein
MLYLSVNRYDAAEKLLKATLADYGPLANIHNLLGVTYHKQSKFPEALREFNKAFAANPEFVEAAMNMAVTLCDLSCYDEAREVYSDIQKRISQRKKQPSLVLGRLANQHAQNGKAYEESGMYTDAVGEYRKALTLFERMPDVKLSLAKLYFRLGQHEKARQEFEEIIKMDPEMPGVRIWLGILYYKLGRLGEARKQWEKASQIDVDELAAKAYLRLSSGWASDKNQPPQ